MVKLNLATDDVVFKTPARTRQEENEGGYSFYEENQVLRSARDTGWRLSTA